jgi:hypothetical protein
MSINILWLGALLGLILEMWLPALFSFLVGFNISSHVMALLFAIVFTIALRLAKRSPFPSLGSLRLKAFKISPMLAIIAPFFILICVLLSSHVLAPLPNGALASGQSTYGDLPLHAGIANSIATQGTFPPEYSILPGTRLSYPFLFDSLSASFIVLGTPLRDAILLPSALFSLVLFVGFYLLAHRITRSHGASYLAFIFFFLNGGFGFIHFIDGMIGNPESFNRIFTSFYRTPTNLWDASNPAEPTIRWVNTICDMIIPQRTTLAGWTVFIGAVYSIIEAMEKRHIVFFILAGIIGGSLPMIHTHSFLALCVLFLVWGIIALKQQYARITSASMPSHDEVTLFARPFDEPKFFWLSWGSCAAALLALALPQLLIWTLPQSLDGSFIKLHWDWVNDKDIWPWFWIKNVGVVFLLLPLALVKTTRRNRLLFLGPTVIFILAECILFQPNPYDNNKLFFIWYLFACMLAADYVVSLFTRIGRSAERWIMLAMIVFFSVFSASLSLGRELVSSYEQFDKGAVKASAYIQSATRTDALFLTATNHNNLVSTLSGRSIYVGSGSYLYFHGLNYQERERFVQSFFANPIANDAALRKAGISHILYGPYEKRLASATTEIALKSLYQIVYESEGYIVFQVQ